MSKCDRSSRPFLNRMLKVSEGSAHDQNKINLNGCFYQELAEFHKLFPKFNGTAFFKHSKHYDKDLRTIHILEKKCIVLLTHCQDGP